MKIAESDIGAAVMDYLIHDNWDCYPEAQFNAYGQRADIAAVKGGILLVVECKTSCNLALFQQARGWIGRANLIAIAHPARQIKASREIEQYLLDTLGLGRFTVDFNQTPEYRVHMDKCFPYHRSRLSEKYIDELHEDMKRFAPGSEASAGFSTPWSRTMNMVKEHIVKNPGTTIKDVMTLSDRFHYSSRNGARQCIRKWLEDDKEIVVRRGKEYRYFHKDSIAE